MLKNFLGKAIQSSNFILMAYDVVAVNMAYFLALWIRFDCVYSQIPADFWGAFAGFCPVYGALVVAAFYAFRLYQSIWRYASYVEVRNLTLASGATSAAHAALITLIWTRMPITYYALGAVLQLLFVGAVRFGVRFLDLRDGHRRRGGGASPKEEKILVVGAGEAGRMLVHDVLSAKESREGVACFIDDDPSKRHKFIDGIEVVGGREEIPEAVEKYGITKIYLAIPSATVEQKREIVEIANGTGREVKMLPGGDRILAGEVSVKDLKDIEIEDLLGREPVRINMDAVYGFIHDRVVLVTGGGGSIGSELCRQIADHRPAKLVIVDFYENNAYRIQLELRESHPELSLATIICSVRDSRKMFQVFEEFRPQIVYHAAAHKHVPLMEDSPCEAIKNNALGTYKTAYAAMIHGCERFVLISTDKAVNPTNVMGASKRICEMIVQGFDKKIKEGKADEIPQLFTHRDVKRRVRRARESRFLGVKTEFSAVRFGNVLGSSGSVVPIFMQQIAAGGPVTVTHPEITRFFMTIPEAVSLVMLAGTYAKGGEIFVLDMGSPVKIADLARNMIRLSGLRPDVDIKIEYTGLRPGEKLYEETLMDEEGLKGTENQRIAIGRPLSFKVDAFFEELYALMEAAYKNKDDIRERMMRVVGTYRPAQGQEQG